MTIKPHAKEQIIYAAPCRYLTGNTAALGFAVCCNNLVSVVKETFTR
jgi:hypothetical protein